MQVVPVLGPVHRGGAGTETWIGEHGVMPSIPFSELALSHGQRRVLRAWRIEVRMTGKYTSPDDIPPPVLLKRGQRQRFLDYGCIRPFMWNSI